MLSTQAMSTVMSRDASQEPLQGGVVIPFNEERGPSGGPVPQPRFEPCSKWLELAIRHASDAQVAKHARVAAWEEGTDEGAKTAALEWECEASMQAMVACAIAIEALSATLQTRIELPRLLIDRWRENRTPQHMRVTEILRRALTLKPRATKALHQNLSEILRFRDLAIGAISRADALVLHPELQAGVEWRFAYFRCDNALTIMRATSRLIWELTGFRKPRDGEVRKYMDAVHSRIEAIPGCLAFRTWLGDGETPPAVTFCPDDIPPALLLQAGSR